MEEIKKYYIKTFGCQANKLDSQDMGGILEAIGLVETRSLADADLIILNSCSVRQKAEDKVYGFGKKVKELKKSAITPTIILAGCMVGSATGERKRFEIDFLKKKMPWVDYFISPLQIRELPKILYDANLVSPGNLRIDTVPPKPARSKLAYVNISTGCDNFCTFCVVPYARGSEISRSREDILDEVKKLTNAGYEEIMLIAQNVNSWGLSMRDKFKLRAGSKDKLPFADLLRDVHKIDKVKKIGFISSNPFDFTQDLIEAIKLPKIERYLHIAVQSGDDDILKKMNRRYTAEEFESLISKIRKAVPDIRIGTDIIVGFPGETQDQFMNTVKLCEKIRFNVAYISMYSPRKGTIAAKDFIDDVPLKEKKRRHRYLTSVVDSFR